MYSFIVSESALSSSQKRSLFGLLLSNRKRSEDGVSGIADINLQRLQDVRCCLSPNYIPCIYILRWNSGYSHREPARTKGCMGLGQTMERECLHRLVSSGIAIPATCGQLPLFLAGDARQPLSRRSPPPNHPPPAPHSAC
jgi:hypothetical protein